MDQAVRGLLTVARGVLEQLDLEVVLERVLDAARESTGARYAALGVLDPDHGRPERLLARSGDPDSNGFPVGHPRTSSFIGVPIVIDGRPYGNLYLAEKVGGGEFTTADEEGVVMLAELVAAAVDHARRFTSSEAQRLELERTVSALDATLQFAGSPGGQNHLGIVLELVAKRGRALVSARALVIELVREDQLELAAGAGELPVDLLGQRVPLRDTVAGAALRGRRNQRLTDDSNRARFEQHGLGHLGLSASHALVVPLIFRDRGYGVLVAVDQLEGGEFSAEHERLLTAFAASAATAVATAESAEDEHRRQRVAAAEAQRSHWARELHDETLQALGNLRLTLAAARRSGEPERMVDAIDRSLEQLDLDIVSLRALITELRPAALDQLGLEPALLALIDRARAGGLDVDAHVELRLERREPADRLTPELETGAYRLVQEALTNAVRHGNARRAVVEVIEDEEYISVLVRDDGAGFDPAASTSGFGLLGMRERAELLGGSVVIDSSAGAGTTVSVSLPAVHVGQSRRPVGFGADTTTG